MRQTSEAVPFLLADSSTYEMASTVPVPRTFRDGPARRAAHDVPTSMRCSETSDGENDSRLPSPPLSSVADNVSAGLKAASPPMAAAVLPPARLVRASNDEPLFIAGNDHVDLAVASEDDSGGTPAGPRPQLAGSVARAMLDLQPLVFQPTMEQHQSAAVITSGVKYSAEVVDRSGVKGSITLYSGADLDQTVSDAARRGGVIDTRGTQLVDTDTSDESPSILQTTSASFHERTFSDHGEDRDVDETIDVEGHAEINTIDDAAAAAAAVIASGVALGNGTFSITSSTKRPRSASEILSFCLPAESSTTAESAPTSIPPTLTPTDSAVPENGAPSAKLGVSASLSVSDTPTPPEPEAEGEVVAAVGGPSLLQGWQWTRVENGLAQTGGVVFDGAASGASPHAAIASVGVASTESLRSPPAGGTGLTPPRSRSLRRGRPPGPTYGRQPSACLEAGCKRTPTYGVFGEDKGSYCPVHGKARGLQNVVTPRCRFRNPGNKACPLWPAFGREKDKSPTYCAQHALEGMKNINNPKCRTDGCYRWPSYGMLGTKTPIYCVSHKVDSMIDVVKPRCREEGGCERRPSFGWPADKVPTYCRTHKPNGMVDVANPRCTHEGCGRRPSFGLDGRRPSRCATHKLDDMVDVVKARCRTPGCNRIAYYKMKGTKGMTRCSQHQVEGMVRSG